jgi:hypothetical protein
MNPRLKKANEFSWFGSKRFRIVECGLRNALHSEIRNPQSEIHIPQS